jgi:hypothetical protein
MERRCQALNEKGDPCQQRPLTESDYCFWHDPEYAPQATQARRSGGAARAREHALRHVYQIDEALDSHEKIRRLVELATTELLSLENSVGRNRAILAAAGEATKLLAIGELAAKLERVRSILEPRQEAEKQQKRRWLR